MDCSTQSVNWVPRFWGNMLPPSSEQRMEGSYCASSVLYTNIYYIQFHLMHFYDKIFVRYCFTVCISLFVSA